MKINYFVKLHIIILRQVSTRNVEKKIGYRTI